MLDNMITPRRPIDLCDFMDYIDAGDKKLVALMVDHDGISDFYDSEDIEFVDPDLFERNILSYKITYYKRCKVGLHVVLD